MKKEPAKLKQSLDLTDPASIDKYHFYDSIFIVVDAVKTYAQRFVELSKQMAETATPERRRNCLKLQRFAQKVPYEPAKHLQRLFSLFGLSNVFFRLNQMDTHFHMAVLTNICIHTLKLIWKVDGKLNRVLLNA